MLFVPTLLFVVAESTLAQCAGEQLPRTPSYRAQLGQAVAAHASRALVTAPGVFDLHGGAFLFSKDETEWSVEAVFAPEVPSSFGDAAILRDNIAVVGASWANNPDAIEGRVFIFERSVDGDWNRQRLVADEPDNNPSYIEHFGRAIARDGDTLLVGAYNIASAYIFERIGAGQWVQTARLAPTDGHGRYFGYSVAIDGDLAVVGACEDFELRPYGGAAYIYVRQGNDVWAQVDKLHPSDPHSIDHFGYAVAIDDGAILVGSELGRVNGRDAGGVYVFEPDSSGGWSEIQKFNNPAPRDGDEFGTALAVADGMMVVGAIGFASTWCAHGGAFVYQRQPDRTWRNIGLLMAPDGQDCDYFGYSVAISGDHAVVGAPYRDQDGVEDAGAAYVFHISRDDDGDGAMDDCQCDCDANFDGVVGLTDLAFLLADFGRTGPDVGRVHGDFDNDRDVDLSDLARLLSRFGSDCP